MQDSGRFFQAYLIVYYLTGWLALVLCLDGLGPGIEGTWAHCQMTG